MFRFFLFRSLLVSALYILPFCVKPQPYPTNAGDSLALVDLYLSAGGPNWGFKWDLSKKVTEWHGVTFVNTPGLEGRVYGLSLSRNNMKGTLPASLGNLTALRFASFWFNQLSGGVPPELGRLTALTSLDLADNSFSGTIPEPLGNLTNLEFLHMGRNLLGGKIPLSIANLQKLQFLYLDKNYFTFDGFEEIYTALKNTTFNLTDQAKIIINNNKGVLSVTANGTLRNNTYTWYNRSTLESTVIAGDSTFKPAKSGEYTVTVKNAIIGDNYKLYSFPNNFRKLSIDKHAILSPYIRKDGTIDENISFSAQGDIDGLAADGITKILLTIRSLVPVTVSIKDTASGGFTILSDQGVVPQKTIAGQPDENGIVKILYNAPDGFGNSGGGMRKLVVHASSKPGEDDTTHITLMTPPVVLVHGMWSNP